MDGCLNITPLKIPRPSYLSFVDLAIIEEKQKEKLILAEAKEKYGDIPLEFVIIYKTKPTIGIAIEGGFNTRQPVPKIISIQRGGSAFESGLLRCGHLILEVNGRNLRGMSHCEAVKVIADAFQDTSSDQLNLIVSMDPEENS
ncbi:whirlin-like [Crassostrea virginica]